MSLNSSVYLEPLHRDQRPTTLQKLDTTPLAVSWTLSAIYTSIKTSYWGYRTISQFLQSSFF